MSAQASPANSVANCTFNSVDNDTLIAKVQLVGRNDLLYKKVRVSKTQTNYQQFDISEIYFYRSETMPEHLMY